MDDAAMVSSDRRGRLWWTLLLGPGLVYGLLIHWSAQPAPYPEYWSEVTTGHLWYGVGLYFVVGGGWLYLLLTRVSRERLTELNLQPGVWWQDLLEGAALFYGLMLAMGWIDYLIWTILPDSDSGALAGMLSASLDPAVLLVMLLPYTWLAAAVFEELLRAVLLTRLWQLFPALLLRLAAVALGGLLFGLCHLYYGTAGAISTGIFGTALCLYYFWRGRFLPLVVAHGLYGTYAVIAGLLWQQQYGS